MVESDSLGNRAIIDRTPLFPADGSQWSSLANLNHHTDVHMEKIVISSRLTPDFPYLPMVYDYRAAL